MVHADIGGIGGMRSVDYFPGSSLRRNNALVKYELPGPQYWHWGHRDHRYWAGGRVEHPIPPMGSMVHMPLRLDQCKVATLLPTGACLVSTKPAMRLPKAIQIPRQGAEDCIPADPEWFTYSLSCRAATGRYLMWPQLSAGRRCSAALNRSCARERAR